MGNSNTEEGVRGTGDSKVKCAVISAKLLFSKQANLITDITKRNGLSEEIPDFFPVCYFILTNTLETFSHQQ